MSLIKVRTFAGGWGLVCGLVLAGLVQIGCQSGSPHSKFAEVPGVTATPASPAAPAAPAKTPVAAVTTTPVAAVGTVPGGPIDNDVLASGIIKPGDMLKITFSDLPPPQMAPIEQRVKEDGAITLLLNQEFTAAGKTRGELEREIRKRYVPDLFRALTVNVEPLSATQFYYVDGEVKMPDRQVYISRMTVLKAIASAKGFTDFAKKTGVVLTRLDGRKITVNCIKAQKDPKLDLEVFPGDKVWVPRRVNPFWQ